MASTNSRVAIVTGASRGIGAAIAARLARDGFAVALNYAGNASGVEAQLARLSDANATAMAVQADVSDAGAMRSMFVTVEATLGDVDVLVNNAGIMLLSTLEDASDALFDRQVAVNLKGAFNGMREAPGRLRVGGRIISLSSSVVGLNQPTYGIYAATKAGVETMTRVLAGELRGRQVTVNAVAPGPTGSDLFLTGKSPDLIDRLRNLAPLERLGAPEDVASVVSFLAGPDGAWVNGQVLRANGGIV